MFNSHKEKEIISELTRRSQLDQKLLNENKIEEWNIICKDNEQWLRQLINEYGWLDEERFDNSGELCAWLIVQHAQDLEFQKKCLNLMEKLPQTKERQEHIHYLTDRILVKEGKEQRYQTQN